MTTVTETETERLLWLAVGANPADQLPRLVLADKLDENAGEVRCPVPTCGNPAKGWDGFYRCRTCGGTGYVSDGRAGMAAALRATADRVPSRDARGEFYWWYKPDSYTGDDAEGQDVIDLRIWLLLSGRKTDEYADYPTALAAIRDLCRAWVQAHKGGAA